MFLSWRGLPNSPTAKNLLLAPAKEKLEPASVDFAPSLFIRMNEWILNNLNSLASASVVQISPSFTLHTRIRSQEKTDREGFEPDCKCSLTLAFAWFKSAAGFLLPSVAGKHGPGGI